MSLRGLFSTFWVVEKILWSLYKVFVPSSSNTSEIVMKDLWQVFHVKVRSIKTDESLESCFWSLKIILRNQGMNKTDRAGDTGGHGSLPTFLRGKKKKGRQRQKRKGFKAETIKRLSPSSKYCFSHSRASRIRKFSCQPTMVADSAFQCSKWNKYHVTYKKSYL